MPPAGLATQKKAPPAYAVLLDKAKGNWRYEGDTKAFFADLHACADYNQVDAIARRYVFAGSTDELPNVLTDIWLAGQFRYWLGRPGTTEDHDFAGKLKKRFADYFTAGRVNAKEVQMLSYLWSLHQFGFSVNVWLDAKPEVQQTYRTKVENLGNDLEREYTSLFDYTKWLKETASAGEAASLSIACLLSPQMLDRYLQETELERTAVKSAHALEEYYRKWRPVADAQLRHLDALVKDDEAFERLRYMWRNGHGDPRIVVTELSAIAVRHGVAVLTDAEIEAMAQSADAGEGAN